MGHGVGDKKYGGTPAPLETYNYHFISGNKHLEKLKDIPTWDEWDPDSDRWYFNP